MVTFTAQGTTTAPLSEAAYEEYKRLAMNQSIALASAPALPVLPAFALAASLLGLGWRRTRRGI